MDYIMGFRFHPTDAEGIELLWDKINLDRHSIVQVGDSLVQVISQLNDMCEFEPEELPGRSEVTTLGISSAHQDTSTAIVIEKTGLPRMTLVFYKGRVSDKKNNENRTPWVLLEFELTVNLPNQKSLTLCKLKKKYGKVDVSRGEEGQSSHLLPSSLENHCTNNAVPKDRLNSNEPLIEPEAFTEYSGYQNQFTTSDDDADDDKFLDSLLIDNDEFYSIEHKFVDKEEGPQLSSNFQIHAAANDIPKPSTSEQDDAFRNSIFFTTDEVEAYTQTLRRKQQNIAAKNEGLQLLQ
ncbi:hypothetical protein DITRI_Ditri11bG0131700 [Diplodiscus trichospermus]